ncbi:alpha/beta hydrolase [Clostridium sp. SYSU_GA19001]|uniref:alpha/beta hydrolase n=1 Tax=Clostridium caldaquaticum TaxID=2940653 RepID=UPI002077417D|nr:alpha/beta hydrolase [Clostridium caldaquaticum]MCM8710069.1 alpha/beta hydrolase [Clostridium caldaquaticum]
MSVTSDMLRKMFHEVDEKRDAGLVTPQDIIRYDDIVYGENRDWQVLDVYRPKNVSGVLPVIVSVHGGGWVYGDKERYQFYCMSLAQRGFAVVNYTYRLAPEYKFPASLEDTNLVFHWVLSNAKQYEFDTDYIFAVGDSAGAHILGLYTAICTNSAYAAKYDFCTPKGFVPKALALNCGAYEIKFNENSDDLTQSLMADYLPEKGSLKELEMINVINHVTKDFPPTFLMTSNRDFLKEQPPVMIQKLMEVDVPFVFRFYGDKEHELAHVFHLNLRSKEGQFCNDEECEFFRKFVLK